METFLHEYVVSSPRLSFLLVCRQVWFAEEVSSQRKVAMKRIKYHEKEGRPEGIPVTGVWNAERNFFAASFLV